MFKNRALLTDLYQLTMMQAYFEDNRENEPAAFYYFFRKLPFDGGYAIFAGLNELLESLQSLKFKDDELSYLSSIGFKKEFLEYLKNFAFRGDILAMEEGSVIFPEEPVISVRGSLIEAQFVETLLLNTINFNSLIATKASRMRLAAGDKILGDFGLRRSHGLGGIQAAKAAVIGGFDSTSNVIAAKEFDIKAVGTMAHSYVQSYDNELTAFRKFAESQPDNCTLLVDTYDTLKSGLPNAIKIGKEMEKKGEKLNGIRLDSGDIISLSKEARKMLDDAGLDYVKIVASNQLDEYMIMKVVENNAPIDIFGVGTRLVTGQPDAALDGVYKLSMINGNPTLKLSETVDKITLPGLKQVFRFLDNNKKYSVDAVVLEDEDSVEEIFNKSKMGKLVNVKDLDHINMLQPVMHQGKITVNRNSVEEIRETTLQNLSHLPIQIKKIDSPETYPVGISKKLMKRMNELIEKHNN